MGVWNGIMKGQIIWWAFVISYGYTFHSVRNGFLMTPEESRANALKEHGLKGIILDVIFTEIFCIVVSFFFSMVPLVFLLLAFTVVGSMIDWFVSLL